MVARATGVGAGAARTAPEALLARHDAELRLLESVRRCVAAKLKCDRDYALALAAVAAQGQKADRQDELQGSLVAQAWRGLMAELEGAGRLLRAGADGLEARALERLHALQAEKRRARKQLQEEHGRLAARLAHLTEDVSRKKAEYQKYLELYRLMRSRFEEHFVKAGRGGRKLDETRDKLQKACRKLHLTHNEYVLLLGEAADFEREYRGALLPALLQRQQEAHEAFVTSWSEVLREVARNLSFADEAFAEVQRRADGAVGAIKPAEEYAVFADKYKSSATPATSSFIFDDSLAEDSSGRLMPGRLAVDNLTVESLRSKMADLEAALKELQVAPLATPDGGDPAAPSPPAANGRANDAAAGGGSGAASRHGSTVSEAGRAEAAEARARERSLSRQLEMVRGALSEQGSGELPAGCDLAALDAAAAAAAAAAALAAGAAPSAAPAADAVSVAGASQGGGDGTSRPTTPGPGLPPQGDVSAFTLKRQQQRLANLLRRPFRRKSVPSTPVLDRAMGARGGSEPADDTAATQPPAGGAGGGAGAGGGGAAARALADEDWFHGVLPREEVVRLLTREGDFLVRQTTRNDECQTVLSVCWGGHKHFIVQTTAEGHFRFEGPAFPTIPELIAHQLQSGLPVTGRSGAVLRRPILRERWELNNDDVLLLDKIGRGNFGDVYKARLKSSGQEVAVKTCRVTLPEEHRRKFLQEGRILKQYDHPNVVRLIGICVQKQPIMIVMELVPGGSLLTFLRNRAATLTQRQLLGMCRDAAAGMRYLESRNCIHRDLAARNCLVGYENIVKISDFGMSREEEEYIVSDGMKQIPIKWTAPEALNFGKYTSLCDVWSYGVLSWEVFARGGTPYSGMSNSKAREKIDAGYRMPAPEGCPDEMYRLMLRCWEYEPENRPHFEQIYLVVDTLFGAQR